MILIRPSATIIHYTLNALQLIEAAGRTCYKSEDKITNDSAEKFVRSIIERGHESVLEHASMQVKFICDRGVSHEIVRHRIAGYSQESTRYCDYDKNHVTFVIPPWLTELEPGQYSDIVRDYPSASANSFIWFRTMFQAEQTYKTLREMQWRPEQARSVLPNSLKTELIMTANFRSWRHFFKLRTAKAAHPQMRELTIPLLKEAKNLIPIVFDDITL